MFESGSKRVRYRTRPKLETTPTLNSCFFQESYFRTSKCLRTASQQQTCEEEPDNDRNLFPELALFESQWSKN